MSERQPGRPSEDEFIGAASRFLKNNYQAEPIYSALSYHLAVYYYHASKQADIDTIRRECRAEGLPGKRESMRDFAIRQLAAYQNQRSR